jgi:hypothetical protein
MQGVIDFFILIRLPPGWKGDMEEIHDWSHAPGGSLNGA